MAAREGVRSSARLSGASAASAAPSPAPALAAERSAAAAALRRARAARTAERAREVEDSPQVLREKCRRLARALRNAKHLVVYTGAGISTAADIPDYRGPRGVWTRLQRGERVARVDVSRARPTFTHMALTALWTRGVLKFVVSQNCDGLHVRAGLPRRALAELHGDMYAERCPARACRRLYLRAFDTTQRTARHAHATRRLCHARACGRQLRDSIVHFGERGRAAWPLNWAGALRHAAAADVVLCLGSSLKVLRRYPRLWRMQAPPRSRPALYIVNLQWTPKDAAAALKINARCDAVMRQLARRLRLRVPRYRARRDPLLAHAEPLAPPERHTCSRPALSPPPPGDPDSDTSYYTTTSTSDEDDELPLRRLAERLRPPPPPPQPAPPGLHSFQVNLESGKTTIILRSEHAPADPPPPEPPPPLNPPVASIEPRSTTDALRRYRITRPSPLSPPPPPPMPPPLRNGLTNGHTPSPTPRASERDVKPELPSPAKIKKEELITCDGNGNGSWLRRLLDGAKPAPDEASASLAAAIIRRAVLVCRAQLYPGLHTILAPPASAPSPAAPPSPSPPAPAECAWCLRRYGTRRCLWYGPARHTAPERRAWRRERGRRYLCACCGRDGEADVGEGGDGGEVEDGGGWYGKGCRKGRRRR